MLSRPLGVHGARAVDGSSPCSSVGCRNPPSAAHLESEDQIRQSNDCQTDQRCDNRDRGDPIRLLELTELPVGHVRLPSNCSKSQPYDPSKQTPEEGRYAEEHKRGHHQQARSPNGRVARLII